MDKDLQVVGFRIGDETFGVPISTVREIVRVPEITVVPNAPGHIVGVINLRGKIVPVMDLRKRFGATDVEINKKTRILVVEVENKTVGLIVHSASEVLKIPPCEVVAPSSMFQEDEVSYVTGVGKLNGRLVILLDIGKIMQSGDLRRLEQAAAESVPVLVGTVIGT